MTICLSCIESGGKPKAKRNSYVCPFPMCDGVAYDRLADHISYTHKLKGPSWKLVRQLLLTIAHGGCDFEEEAQMLKLLPAKFEDFSGEGISIDYLDDDMEREGWESDMLMREMMLPCPVWAQTEHIDKTIAEQVDVAVDIFGPVPEVDGFGMIRGRNKRAYIIEDD